MLLNLGLFIAGATVSFLVAKIIAQNKFAKLETEKAVLQEMLNNLTKTKDEIEGELAEKEESLATLRDKLIRLESEHNNLLDKEEELQDLHKKFQLQFENLANKILKESSKEMTDTSHKKLEEMIKPMKEEVKNVKDYYEKGIKNNANLEGQITKLFEFNQKVSDEAQNLVKALKGNNKTQGNWGEVILETVLESAGLSKGTDFKTQYHTEDESGKRILPDVVVFLPQDKHIIIDSKVVLTNYYNFINNDDDEKKLIALKKHIAAIKNHVKELSDKQYHKAKDLKSPDFVVLFIPNDPSFSVAIQGDETLFSYAWERKIIIATPNTLFGILNIVSTIWRQERQNKNALEIAKRSGMLYDKFVGFIEDMKKIDKAINHSKEAYDSAISKLKDGKGNLVSRVENIKKLGASSTKTIPQEFSNDDVALLDSEDEVV
jgi:DNA recombination protein RmuC